MWGFVHFSNAQNAKAALTRYEQLRNEGKQVPFVSEFRYKKEAPWKVKQKWENHWDKKKQSGSA